MKRFTNLIIKAVMVLLLILVIVQLKAQSEEIIYLNDGLYKMEGTLLIPKTIQKIPIAIMISGSGPTDRDGNNPIMKNNSLKMLAEGLAENNIASLRFDKRGIGKSAIENFNELELLFDQYINDVIGWIKLLKSDARFSDIIIIGHSEGSLIGMVAAGKTKVTKFISIAGAAEPIDKVIKQQLIGQPQVVLDNALPILDSLSHGVLVKNVPAFLNSLFRESVQPYMISWIKYNPQVEIEKLGIPVLVLQGTTDIQITVSDAEKLNRAAKNSDLVIIEGMNHVLKDVELDRQKNIASYSNPDLPLNSLLKDNVVTFILSE